MELRYTGPRPTPGSALPLPEGWPAFDHTDDDADRARAKVASGNYEAARPKRGAAAPAEEE